MLQKLEKLAQRTENTFSYEYKNKVIIKLTIFYLQWLLSWQMIEWIIHVFTHYLAISANAADGSN